MTRAKLLVIIPGLLLQGCTTAGFLDEVADPQAGLQAVSARTSELSAQPALWIRSADDVAASRERVRQLLGDGPIDEDTAVRIAILNNKGLQAAYAEMGISAADLWQSLMLENPRVAIGVTGVDPLRSIEGVVVANILALLTRERRIAIAEIRFDQAQSKAVESTLRLITETRRAWATAVSAWEAVTYYNQAQAAAEAASELAERLGQSGAYTRAAQASQLAFDAELAGEAGQARIAARGAKEELTRLLGLWGSDIRYQVPNSLPSLPAPPRRYDVVEVEALDRRVDLHIARLELAALAAAYGLTEATRYVSDLELAAGKELEKEYEEEGTTKTRSMLLEAEFVIPLFDSGEAKLRKAEMLYLRQANLLAEKAVNIRSEARAAYDAYRANHELARHYRDNVVPLRKVVEEEAVLTYNGMITSTFDLLDDTRARIAAIQQSVAAKRRFWLADINLDAAILGGGSTGVEAEIAAAAPGDAGEGH